MIQSKLTWNGETTRQLVFDAGWDGIKRAAEFYLNTVQKEINTPNTGKRVRRKRNTRAGKKGSSYTIYPNPSEPGYPPHKRTGALAAALIPELDRPNLRARVGVLKNVIYGLYLEFGTRKMAARPFLFATLDKIFPQLKVLAESGKTV